jgi:alpha-L-rhamnosidase
MRKNSQDALQAKLCKLKDAHWIGGAGNVFCRKRFTLDAEIKAAHVWIIADAHSYLNEFYHRTEDDDSPFNWLLGGSFLKYRMFVNGEQVGAGPVRSIETGLPVIQCFDVTQYLTINDNFIGIISRGETRGVGLVLQVEYADGECCEVLTDSSWHTYNGNEVFKPVCWECQSLYSFVNGNPGPGEWPEHLDGRNFPHGWLDSNFDDSNWNPAKTFGNITQQYEIAQETNYELQCIAPQTIKKLANGEFLIDFGRELVGGIEMMLPPGTEERTIELRLGEELLETGRVRFQLRTGNRYQEKWTFSGKGETLAHFGVRAFRYAEVVNCPGELALTSISAVTVTTPFDWNDSSFSCSDAALKQVWDFCKYSIAATSLDVYMDCPSRERLAYEADSYVTMLTHFSVESNIALAKRTFEYQLNHATWPCEWRQLSIPLAYEYLMHSGDYDCIDKYYNHLKTQCSFHRLIDSECDLIKEFPMRVLVDWPPV